jgi:HEAT repeat protein
MSIFSRGSKHPPEPEEPQEQPPAPDEPPFPPVEPSRLDVSDPGQLKAVLRDMAETGVPDSDVERIEALLAHQDAEMRLLALAALRTAGRIEDEPLDRALNDPIDEVRASAVRLAASTGTRRIGQLVPLVGARRWPLVQQAALEVLPGMVEGIGSLAPVDVSSLCVAVAQMPSPPLERERERFGALARAVGVGVLLATVPASDHRRLGAARLLAVEGSHEALAGLASLAGDPDEEMRALGEYARDLLDGGRATPSPQQTARADEQQAPPLIPPRDDTDRERIAALAAALLDPDETARERAMSRLAEPGWTGVLGWVRESMSDGDAPTAALAAHLAGTLVLTQEAPRILQRASEQPVERQGPFVRALASFDLSTGALVDLVSDLEPSARAATLPLVWELGGRAVLPTLAQRMPDASRDVRIAILRVFEQSLDPSAFTLAEEVLEHDPSPLVRSAAVRLLARAGAERRLEALARAMRDPQPAVRVLAIELLPEAAAGRTSTTLLAALDDPDERVGSAALPHLAGLVGDAPDVVWLALHRARTSHRRRLQEAATRVDPDAMRRLRAERLVSRDPADRALALELGFGERDSATVGAAASALGDPDPGVRLAAARVLTVAGAGGSVPELARSLGDPSPEVRVQIVRALADQDERSTLGHLVDALGDPDPQVVAAALEALERLRSRALAHRLIDALDAEALREPAGRLLVGMGPSITDLLVAALAGRALESRRRIGELLERIVGAETFRSQLSAIDRDERSTAVEVLAAIGGLGLIESLVQALSDPDERIRLQSLGHLGELGPNQHVLDAIRWTAANDPSGEVRRLAAEILARLAQLAEGGQAPGPQSEGFPDPTAGFPPPAP